jgi:hypothetical protein
MKYKGKQALLLQNNIIYKGDLDLDLTDIYIRFLHWKTLTNMLNTQLRIKTVYWICDYEVCLFYSCTKTGCLAPRFLVHLGNFVFIRYMWYNVLI